MAKLIIKLINNIAAVVNNDSMSKDKLSVYFLPNYRVSAAEKIIPATDVSEQISTAGTEASGTGNMKFMMNGAITIGTLDGANVEIVEEVGDENAFIFGLKAHEVEDLREKGYNPYDYYQASSEVKEAVDLLFSGHFSINEPGIFEPIRETIFENGDYYMLMADLQSYITAQEEVEKAYKDQDLWAKMAIKNIACSGKFSSDRTINQYAKDIWNVNPCEVGEVNCSSNPVDEFIPGK